MDKVNASTPQGSNNNLDDWDLFDSEGLLVCPDCRERTEENVKDGNGGFRTVTRQCKCVREKVELMREEDDRRYHINRARQLREDGLTDPEYLNWTLSADDRKYPDVSDLCRGYVDTWDAMRDKNLGILFYGDVGVGKSFHATSIANGLIDKLVPVIVTTIPRIIDDIQGAGFGGRNKVFDRLQDIDLLVIDDLGIEYETDYKLEQIYTIFDTRYRSGKPIIVTTNLNGKDLKNEDILEKHRVYDRILQNCYPVKMTGPSRRAEIAIRKRKEFEAILGTQLIKG